MIDNILFSETITVKGKKYTIEATTDDATLTILKKALDIEFKGNIEVYQTKPPGNYCDLPDTYLQVFYNDTDFEYASNEIISDLDEYSIYVITREANKLETLCKRICKALFQRGFCITNTGSNIESSDGDGYNGKIITVTLSR